MPPRSIVVLWFLTACGPSARLSESGDDTGGDSGRTETSDGSDGAGDSETGTSDEGIVGTWVGYGDASELRSGSDRVELRITGVDEAGQI